MPRKKAAPATKRIERNDDGLIEGVEYIYDEEGYVDWRKMISKEHLVPNRQKTQETDVEKLKDKDLLILLAGIKRLARIRGFDSVHYDAQYTPDGVIATCTIHFIPNFETEGRPVVFSAMADATHSNTTNFGKIFLAAVAENRAFVRCVRNFLNINIVGSDELNESQTTYSTAEENAPPQSIDPYEKLGNIMTEKGISWGILKKRLTEENFEGADDFEKLGDIPRKKIFELIQRINAV